MNALKVYHASAGSGKTFALVLHYLLLVLPRPKQVRSVLAVTFTHKATAEMRKRILLALHQLASGSLTPFREVLKQELRGIDLAVAAGHVLRQILHAYVHFHIHTLESFFHGVVMSFARELGIAGDIQTELNTEDALDWVVDNLLDELSDDSELQAWVTQYVLSKLDSGKSWNFRKELHDLAKELLKESADNAFAQGGMERLTIENINMLNKHIEAERGRYEHALRTLAQQALQIVEESGLAVEEDLAFKEKGAGGVFSAIDNGNFNLDSKLNGVRVGQVLLDDANWVNKSSKKTADVLAIAPRLTDCLRKINEQYKTYTSVVAAGESLKRIFFAAPLLRHMATLLRSYRDTHGLLFLPDIARLLKSLAVDSEAPFVYEKIGNRYRHYLIDEFQDTSVRQWENMLPLLLNGLASGSGGMLVGDAKQAIYRWRSGDARLMLNLKQQKSLLPFQSLIHSYTLATNYRSGEHLVQFNNLLFQHAPGVVLASVAEKYSGWMAAAYADVSQQPQHDNLGKGFVHVEFVEKPDEASSGSRTSWKLTALEKTLEQLQMLRAEGYLWQDIALLVRKGDEASLLIQKLLEKGIPALSSEALLVKQSPHVQMLVSMLEWIADPTNDIAKLHLQFASRDPNTEAGERVAELLKQTHQLWRTLTSQRESLLHLQVYELCEKLLENAGIHQHDAYLLQFLASLRRAVVRDGLDVLGVLRWWQNKQEKLAISTPSLGNAVQVMTIHKSKGLEFPVVVLPFFDWEFAPKSQSIFWGSSTQEPYSSLGTMPLPPAKKLFDGPYGDAVEEEFALSYLDNLNLLYVACTRAQERLYGFSPYGKKLDGELTIAKLLQTVVVGNSDFAPHWDSTRKTYHYGIAAPPQRAEQEQKQAPMAIADANSNWRGRLVVRARKAEVQAFLAYSDGSGQMGAQEQPSAVETGSRLHAILAKVLTASHITTAVQHFVFEGMLTQAEAPQLIEKFQVLVSQPEVRDWFTPDVRALTEQELILASGDSIRPDRLVMREGNWVVIDFKTGASSPTHAKQVKLYVDTLLTMGYEKVSGYVMYIHPLTLAAQVVAC